MTSVFPDDFITPDSAAPTNKPSPWRHPWQWLEQTPQRALAAAYEAALKIETIEQENFSGQTIAPLSDKSDPLVFQYFADELNRWLNQIKLRMAEFRLSRFVLNQSNPELLQQLKTIDSVLYRYAQVGMDSTDRGIITPSFTSPPTARSATSQTNSSSKPRNTSGRRDGTSKVMDKTGLLPRSIGVTFNRISTDLKPGSEQQVMEQFWVSRRKTRIALRCLLSLALVPLLVQLISKPLIFVPLLERIQPIAQAPVFLNTELEETTLHQLQQFKERLEFQALLQHTTIAPAVLEAKVQKKVDTLALESRREGQAAIANVLADGLALGAFGLVAWMSRAQIKVLKSFLDDVVYGLSDSAKAFLIIFLTDMFVGFHSPHGWEVILEGTAKHLGLAPNHDLIFLFIATVPVFLDTIFKYWVFRYLSRSSPSAVATLREMDD